MGKIGEGAPREIPAQQQTVDKVTSTVLNLLGEKKRTAYRVGGIESKNTLQIHKEPTEVTLSNLPEGVTDELWWEVSLTEKADILTEKGIATRTQITPFRFDIVAGSPRLRVDGEGSDAYMGNLPPADFMRRSTERNKKHPDERWKPATEADAQRLMRIVSNLGTEDELREFYGTITVAEDAEFTKVYSDIEEHFDRVYDIAKEYLPQGESVDIPLSFDGNFVRFRKYNITGALHIAILQPQNNDLNHAVTENYSISKGSPLRSYATFFHGTQTTSTASLPTETAQREHLLQVLESLSNEHIKEQLANRGAIQKHIDQIIAKIGYHQYDGMVAEITKKAFSVSLFKDEENPFYFAEIESFVHLKSDETQGNVKTFIYSILDNEPIQLKVVGFGQHESECTTGLPTPDQVEYLRILLEEAA